MKKGIIITLGLLLFTGVVRAQQDTESYMETSGGLSTLYRGKIPAQYPYRYNGTYYWDTKEFKSGSVYYNGKLYENVLLNIDAAKQELQVRLNSTISPVVLYDTQVSSFTMDGKLFVNLHYLGYTEAPAGYFEVVHDGQVPLLMQVSKVFTAHAGNHNGTDIGYIDPTYQYNLANYFARQERYYAIIEGKVTSVRKSAWNKASRHVGASTPFLESQSRQWHGISSPATLPVSVSKSQGASLPEGYFSNQQADQEEILDPSNSVVTASYRNKVYFIGSGNQNKPVTVTGIVTDLETEEPLPGVVISDDNTSSYVRTNSKGYYSITLPAGKNTLNYIFDGKENLALLVELRSDGSLNVALPDKVELLKASLVSAQSMANHRTTTIGLETVSSRLANKIPSAFGEGDILKAVLTLPGVKTVGEASGGFNVRGGGADQNLILFNGNTIYNPSHLFGIFSAFNPDIIESVELFKSSIPAQYGGRISSVLSVKSKEGNQERFHGSVGIGLLTSRLHLEAPIGRKKKTTFIAGGRITYSDWLLRLLPANSNYAGGSAGFGDINLGLTHRFNSRNTLQISAYAAQDRFSFSGDTTFRYTNLNTSIHFRHKGSNGGSFNISAGYDQYGNATGVHNWADAAFDLETHIRQIFARAGFNSPLGKKHMLNYGVDMLVYMLDPGSIRPYGNTSTIAKRTLSREIAVEPAAYISDNWNITEHFSLEGGIRLSGFLFTEPSKFYGGPEFRISARYSPLVNLSFKGGFNTMRQYIHLISNTASVSPMDTWKLSDANIAPTTGWQGAAGVYWTHLGSGIDFSLEGYWKQTQNCLDYRPGASLTMNPNLSFELLPVYGRAYGVEAMIKKTTGKLTGWISYCYSRSQYREMQDRGFETISGGNWYNAPYDKPHEVKVVANWAITHRFSLSTNLDYSTGRPVTVPVGRYVLGGAYRLAYTDRNSYRIPDYFRLDLAMNIDPGHKKTSWLHTMITLGVYNVTGRKNAYSVFFKTEEDGNVKGYMLSVFACQIPYININFLF